MHSYEMGRTRSEELRKAHGQKINDSDVPVIRQRFEDGETYEAISMDYPITKGSVRDICRGVSYKHIPLVGESRRRRYTRNLPPNADRSKLGHCDDERPFQDYVRSLSAADLYQLNIDRGFKGQPPVGADGLRIENEPNQQGEKQCQHG